MREIAGNTGYIGVPKLQKSPVAVNQQGHFLSYVLGVYFGDASIHRAWTNDDGSETLEMRLRVIDEEFIARFGKSVEEAFPGSNPQIKLNIKNGEKGHLGKKPLHYVRVRRGVPEYIQSIAGKKTLIPNIVYRSDDDLRAFVEGILDSEGWVHVASQEKGRFYLQIGFAMASDLVYEMQKMLNRMGVKTARIKTKHYPSGKLMRTCMFNTASFIDSGLRFTASRKQKRIDAFVEAQQLLREAGFKPNGQSFNDYKLRYREGLRDDLLANV